MWKQKNCEIKVNNGDMKCCCFNTNAHLIVQKREKVEYVKSTHFNPSMWLTRLSKGREERSSIFIGFPGFGESHVHFKKWAHSLSGRGSSVYAVCFPGRMHRVREAPFTTFEEISGSVVDALLELRVVQPHMESRIVCFGHGCGALIAFEVTRLLANLDIAVSHLVISASRSPQKQTKINEDRFGIKIFCMANKDLLSWIKRLGGVPAFMLERNDMMKLWIDLVRADFHVHEHYALYLDDDKGEGGGYCLSCPLTTIGCDDDPSCDPEELEHWKEVTSGLHTHCMFPDGGHSYLHTRPEYSHQVLTLLGAICGGDDSPHFQRPELPDDGESW